MSGTLPEPPRDARAQIAAVADPRNPKTTAFLARGTKIPMLPGHLHVVHRPEGSLVTSVPAHARAFANAPRITDGLMHGLLGYPEPKAAAVASGAPSVVQGVGKGGAVVHEMLASPQGIAPAMRQATDIAGSARVVPMHKALLRRLKGLQR